MSKPNKTHGLAERVETSLRQRPEVRPFPAAVTQLLAACKNPDANAATFEKIIECDPGLSVRLLRMANSPIYGLAREVGSVGHATTILGMRQLKSLALSVAGAGMFAVGSTATKQRQTLWEHSMGCATVGRLLARSAATVSPDDAFLAGIFHDVGKLLLYDVAPDEYTKLTARCKAQELIEEEERVFGINHEEIGLKSAHSWGLSEDLKMAIGFHHKPNVASAHMELVMLIHTANDLALAWGIGSSDSGVCDETLERLSLDDESLANVRDQARRVFHETMQALAV